MTSKAVSVRPQAPHQQDMKVDVQVRPFFTAVLAKGNSQIHSPDNNHKERALGTHWMSPRPGLDKPLAKRRNHVTLVPVETLKAYGEKRHNSTL